MKRLICLFDGTWDEPTDARTLTNVVKLAYAISPKDQHGNEQMLRYEIGIATGGQGWQSFIAGALGLEVSTRIQTTYRWLCEVYQPGDEIFLFGFSRGAFQARSLANLIGLSGLAHGASIEADAKSAWSLYERNKSRPDPSAIKNLCQRTRYPVPIRLVGVWDTVGNLGLPVPDFDVFNGYFTFHDLALPAGLEVGLHALAIDEPRGPFSPTLWTLPKGRALKPGQTIEQVWFPGSHADVGGGLEASGLSDGALVWMGERAAALTGLGVDFGRLLAPPSPQPLAEQYCPTTGLYKVAGIFPYLRLIQQNRRAMGWLRRTLFRGWRTSQLPAGEVSINETVHASAVQRFGRTVPFRYDQLVVRDSYLPANLAAVLDRRIVVE
jgi:uncharacterized protein (DUF2235 family)